MDDLIRGIEHLKQAMAHISKADHVMSDHISKLKALEEENAALKAEIDDWKGNGFEPDAYMKLPVDADGVPIRIGDEMWLQPNEGGEPLKRTVVGYRASTSMGLTCFIGLPDKLGNTETCVSYLWSHKKHEPPDSWEKLEEDAFKTACDYANAPLDEDGLTTCKGCRFREEPRSCHMEMTYDVLKRAKRLAGIENQEGER